MQKKQSRTARFIAADILNQVFTSREPVKPLLDRAAAQYGLPSNERNLAMQLLYGVLRYRQTLDRLLELVSSTPLKKLDPFIHQVLAVGLYQLFYLERIPESAAVNEAVKSCRAAGKPKRLQGFVNGVLRQSIRRRNHLTVDAATDRGGLPILNHPQWMTERWQSFFGLEETRRICIKNSCEPDLVLRVNSTQADKETLSRTLAEHGIACRPGRYSPDALVLPDYHGPITRLPGYQEGFFQVQNEAAQLATCLLGPFHKGGLYLDGCAGLGGKTSHLLQLAREGGFHIHAVEPEPHRLQKLRENIVRLFNDSPLDIFGTSLLDIHPDKNGPYDGILIDAPCSGTGVTGRHPDIRWSRRPVDFRRYHTEQLTLLQHSINLLVPGGVLVYATCSLEPEENMAVIQALLQATPQLQLTDCRPLLPEKAHVFVDNGVFAPRPVDSVDGFFAARLLLSP